MRKSTAYLGSLFLFLFACSFEARAQTVIPQIVDGGGWQTTIVLINTSSNPAQANMTFYQESGGETTLWFPSFIDATTTLITLAGGETVIIHTAGTATTTTTGWASIQGDLTVGVYAIFAQSVIGRPNQDGSALASAASSRVLVSYNNTNGFVTAIAIANTGSTPVTINVGLKNTFSTGLVSPAPPPITLPPLGHTSFNMPQMYLPTSNQIGTAEFTTSGGSISVLALLFDPTGSFASAPVFPETGGAILGGTGGTGTVGTFNKPVD